MTTIAMRQFPPFLFLGFGSETQARTKVVAADGREKRHPACAGHIHVRW
jgi:hypothetical protein